MSNNPRLLLLTTEPPPVAPVPATGAGLRAWGLAEGLRSAGFTEVQLAFAADAVRGRTVDLSATPWIRVVERRDLDALVEQERPDAIVFQHWGMMRDLKCRPRCPVAMDLAGPHLLERQLWGSPDPAKDRAEKLAALAMADFVVCSGTFQRRYFLPFLFEAGFDPRDAALCPVIPFSMPPEIPDATPRGADVFFYGGTFLPWQDPERTLRTALQVMDAEGHGTLRFVGGPHPSGDVSGGRFDSLLKFLDQHPRVQLQNPMPFPEMLAAMQQCAVSLDLMPRNAERELAFPTRTVVCLWAGLPVLHNDYDELAEPIADGKAGWIVDPLDSAAIAGTVRRILKMPEEALRRGKNARKLVRARYTWDRTIAPLADWCRDPRRREGIVAPKAAVAVSLREPLTEGTAAAVSKNARGKVTYAPRPATTGPNPMAWLLSPLVFLLALPISLLLILIFALAEIAKRLVLRK